jgi:hypothetical protein
MPINITGITFVDLKIVCREKLTYDSAEYCPHDDRVLLTALELTGEGRRGETDR